MISAGQPPETPPGDLLAVFGVRCLESLGGRLNKHWLVGGQGERLVLRRWSPQPLGSIDYERSLCANLLSIGCPVAPSGELIEFGGSFWSLAPFLSGAPIVRDLPEQRSRGRLLAELHGATARIEGLEQRPGWRRFDEILADVELDRTLSTFEATRTEEVRIVRWHLDRARRRIEGMRIGERPVIPVHGDFATWNLLFQSGRLSGILDFELARNDHRVADFGLSWRGHYDEVIRGYDEVSPLEPAEWAMIVPAWWAMLVENACRDMRAGVKGDDWTVTKLLSRSPIMGPDAVETA